MTFVHDLTQKLEDNRELISEWMAKKRSEVPIPIYGSVDIRDAGWKVAVVGQNCFNPLSASHPAAPNLG